MKDPIYQKLDTRDADDEREPWPWSDQEESLTEDSTMLQRISYMASLSVPACVSFFLFSLSNFILMYYAGHLEGSGGDPDAGTVIFAGISLANMYINVTGFAIITGMSTAVETLASQQNGAQRYEEVGLTLLRCLLVMGMLAIPIAAAWYFAEHVFLLLGVEEAVCAVMRGFLRVRICSLPADVFNLSFSKYLMAMGVMNPVMHTTLLISVVLVPLCWMFTAPRFGIVGGANGLAWAFVLSTYIGTMALTVISWGLEEVQRTMSPLLAANEGAARVKDLLNMKQLRAFVALGVPGCAMTCSEWWAFEILTVFASRLGAVAVSAQSIMLQLCVLSFMLPLGISVATSSIVGNVLGADKKRLAIQLSHTSLGIMLALELCVIGPLILWLGPSFVAAFTEDPEVRLLARRTVHLLAFLVVGDGMQGVAGGILRGAGKQLTGALTNLFCYYCLGLPVAWLLCFHMEMGVGGLLLGISLGAASLSCVLVMLIFVRESWMFSGDECGQIAGDNRESSVNTGTDPETCVLPLTEGDMELVKMLDEHNMGSRHSYTCI